MFGFASRSRSFCQSVAGVASVIALSGCAADKPPTLVERVAAAGESHAELAQHIADATDRKNEAEDDVRAAKKAIKKAQKDLEEANERVVETRREVAEAETEAHRRGFVPTPKPEN